MTTARTPTHTLGESSEQTALEDATTPIIFRPPTIPRHEEFGAEFRNVRLPTFWKNRPKLWFVQLESEFSTYRVRSDDVKYSAVIRHLDENTMITVADVLENPPESDKYKRLKDALILRFADSHEKQMRTLLHGIELGDKKPSQLLREMKALAGENATEGLLRTLWLQRLPSRIQEMLLIFDGANLDKLAECADKLKEHPTSVDIHAVQTTPSSSEDAVQQILKQMAALTAKVEKFTRRSHSRGRSQSRSSSRSRYSSKTRDANKEGQCYYHKRFGSQARKCSPPCNAAKGIQGNE